MTSSRSRFESALLVAVVALAASHLVGGTPRAAAQQAAGDERLFAVVSQTQNTNVLFVLDPPSRRLIVFEHRVGGKLELAAIRHLENEVQFDEWSPQGAAARVQSPRVHDLAKELKELQKGK